MVAVQTEMNGLQESLQRNRQRLVQLQLLKTFLTQSKPLAARTFDGLVLGEQLLNVQSEMRSKLVQDDVVGQEMLDQVRAQLLQIQGRFTKGLEPLPIIKTSGIASAMAAGSVITFLLALLWLTARQSWLSAKQKAYQAE